MKGLLRISGIISSFIILFSMPAAAAGTGWTVSSPDNSISINFELRSAGMAYYSVSKNKVMVVEPSKLGLVRSDGDFSKGLSLLTASATTHEVQTYDMVNSKKFHHNYKAARRVFHLKNPAGQKMDVIFQVSNDGVAFRYYFPERSVGVKKIEKELTSFHFSKEAKAWLQPMSDAKTGWEKSNPSYEEYYQKGIAVGTPSPIKAGWVFPALFQKGDRWVLITESAPDGDYCGGRLNAESPDGEYSLSFPDPREVFPGGPVNPESALPWYSPWRILAVGSLKTIAESTLGTDLAKPAIRVDTSFIKPGKSAWSWVLYKDDSTVYHVQKRFIDFAADMNWQYCLIDADWDKRIGYEKVRELADYGRTKQVGLILWYNSAGSWNTTPYTPRNKLLTHELRVAEFSKLKDMGIKGIKVDFFGGDGQSMMNYYQEILKDAATYHLLVNFHGATLPRGLQRTYPNLVTMESIKGMEFRTFDQGNENEAAAHCTTIPFVRNVFDPMDFTPMVLYKIPNIKRSTTNGFELALPVLFLSGVQHLAETPEGLSHVPGYVKDFLRDLPSQWDDVRFIDGYPGKLAVIARRAGGKWYVAGINGEKTDKTLSLDLSFLKGKTGKMITDGDEEWSFAEKTLSPGNAVPVKLKGDGGFVMVF